MGPRTLSPGDRIGEYVLEAPIGSGGFGEVWKARHAILKDKVVAAKFPTGDEAIGTLRKEGVLQHKLDFQGVVRTLGIDLDHDPPYLLMEFVDGEDLGKLIQREAPLPKGRVIAISCQILETLGLAHEAGVVHQDLKPQNVLLPEEGDLKLADFGLGKVADAHRSFLLSHSLDEKASSGIAGTIAYMAPEQASGEGPVDARTDIYGFGVLLFEMLTGELPAGATLPGDLVEGVDDRFNEVYRQCCARREDRYESVREIIDDLQRLTRPPPVRRKARRRVVVRAPEPAPHRRGNAFVAVLLSLLICGLGQFYNGQIGKGFAFLFTYILLAAIPGPTRFLCLFVSIGSMVDAGTTASRMNRRFQGETWEDRRARARQRS
jgi:serine/threonine-protein kinase